MLSVKAVILLDSEGRGVLTKYYTPFKDAKKFEQRLFDKTKKPGSKSRISVLRRNARARP